jgi:hypothetical protein
MIAQEPLLLRGVAPDGPENQAAGKIVTMFRYSLVLTLGLLAAAPAAAASWADGLFDELSKDFGSVPRGPALNHPFRVKNNTKGDVNIARVYPSCSACTSAWAVKSHLAPGEETAVVVRMDTTRFTGPKTVTIFVQFDAPAYEEVRLWVTANGRSDFAISPDGFVFGQVKRGTTPEAVVTVTFYSTGNVKVTEAKAESNYIKTAITEFKDANGTLSYEVRAKLRGDVPVGKWYSDIWLKTNDPSLTQIRVPLNVEVEAPLSITPGAVAMGTVKVQGEAERRVIIRGAQAFKVTKIEGLDDQLTAKDSTEESKQVHVLTLRFKAGRAGEITRTIRIITDLKEDNELELQITAQVAP